MLLRNPYRTLLVTLAVLMVAFPLLRATEFTRFVLDGLFTVVFLATFRVVFLKRNLRVFAFVFGAPTVFGLWSDYFFPGIPQVAVTVGFHLFAILFFSLTIGTILFNIHKQKDVTVDGVCGAFCGYLLMGFVFGNLYSVCELLQPGSFAGDAITARPTADHHFLLTYFSFITLTTIGYGDIVPNHDTVRGLALIEAVCGQFYIAVLIGDLIGKRVNQATTK